MENGKGKKKKKKILENGNEIGERKKRMRRRNKE